MPRGSGTVDLILSSIWLAAVIWLIVRAFNQRNLLHLLEPAQPPLPNRVPRIAVIVPARDEAANISRCLMSLVEQSYPASSLRIIIVDDHSSDATLAIATALAQKYPQLTVLRSPPLPPHWVGKSHACWIGARAVERGVEWLCFIDADVWGEPIVLRVQGLGCAACAVAVFALSRATQRIAANAAA